MKPPALWSLNEKSTLVTRRRNPTRLSAKIANSRTPSNEETTKHSQAHSFAKSTLDADNDDALAGLDFTGHAKISIGVDNRHSPTILPVPRNRLKEFESTIEHQKHEIYQRCVQIADLSNVQQQQAEALLLARDAIAGLDKSVTALSDELAQRDENIAAIKKELQHSNEERTALQNKLTKLEYDSAELLRKHLELSATFNDTELEIVIAKEKCASVAAELIAKNDENRILIATIEKIKKWNHGNSIKGPSQLERRIEELQTLLSARDEQIKALNAAVAKSYARCFEFDPGDEDIKINEISILDRMELLSKIIVALKGTLRTERKVAEQKVSELTNELLRERNNRSVAEHKWAQFRKEIALLLSRIAIAP